MAENQATMAKEKTKVPIELVCDILSRLPAKSILRFKCLSKPLLTILSDPKFIKTQFSRHCSFHKLLLYYIEDECDDLNESLFVVNFDGPVSSSELSFEEIHGGPVSISCTYGSCNGLFLVRDDSSQLVLLNPTTRKSKVLPSPPGVDVFKWKECGIGYDSTSDDHKVVVIFESNAVTVYSLKNDTWKTVSPLPVNGPIKYCQPGDKCNTSPHWYGLIPSPITAEEELRAMPLPWEGSTPNPSITAFNFADEEFREVPLPSGFDKKTFCGLGFVGDYLCLVHRTGEAQNLFEIWVMQEYGVEGSWTNFPINRPTKRILPLFFRGHDEELLLVNEDPLIIVRNQSDGTTSEIHIDGFPSGGQSGWHGSFVECLVPLDNTNPSTDFDK